MPYRGPQLNIRVDDRLRRQWRDIMRLRAALDRRNGRSGHGAGKRALAKALANYRVLLKRQLGPSYRDTLEAGKPPPAVRDSKAPPLVVAQVRDY